LVVKKVPGGFEGVKNKRGKPGLPGKKIVNGDSC